jgi:hypothetical protein
MGAYLARRLNERFGNHPFVGDVRGRGLLAGVELVADRASKGKSRNIAASCRLLPLDVGCQNHRGPFFALVGDEFTEIGRRAGEHGAA